jgi:hypothetical protein
VFQELARFRTDGARRRRSAVCTRRRIADGHIDEAIAEPRRSPGRGAASTRFTSPGFATGSAERSDRVVRARGGAGLTAERRAPLIWRRRRSLNEAGARCVYGNCRPTPAYDVRNADTLTRPSRGVASAHTPRAAFLSVGPAADAGAVVRLLERNISQRRRCSTDRRQQLCARRHPGRRRQRRRRAGGLDRVHALSVRRPIPIGRSPTMF